jgi:hypothetical protein
MRLQFVTALVIAAAVMSAAVAAAQEDDLGPVLTPVPGEGETMTIHAEFSVPPGTLIEVQVSDESTGEIVTCASGRTTFVDDASDRSRITLELPPECGRASAFPLRLLVNGEVADTFVHFEAGASLNLGPVQVTDHFEDAPPPSTGNGLPPPEVLPTTGLHATGSDRPDWLLHPAYALFALAGVVGLAAVVSAVRRIAVR